MLNFNKTKDKSNSIIYCRGKVISNFTQVVWAKTTRVGCAIAKYKDGKYNSYLMVCNYVYGNRYGESVYQAGRTCSACSSCTRRGLCKQLFSILKNFIFQNNLLYYNLDLLWYNFIDLCKYIITIYRK